MNRTTPLPPPPPLSPPAREAAALRGDSSLPDSTPWHHAAPSRVVRAWGAGASAWLRSAIEILDGTARGDRALHEFADIVEEASEPGEIEAALVRLAQELSHARRVELIHEEASAPRRVVRWPRPAGLDAEPGPGPEDAEGPPLRLPIRLGAHDQGMLQLVPTPRQRWSPRLIRRMVTLCTMAAAAERGLRASSADRAAFVRAALAEPGSASTALIRDATFLNAVLPYALGQSQRHQEPLSLLCVGIDRLAAIHELHGPATADRAVLRVAETIARTIRASDVVARLDDDRLIVVLPNSNVANAARVAETVRLAIEVAGVATPSLPVLTASIGVVSYPTHAHDVLSLIAAADDALGRAVQLGRNRVASHAG